MANYKENEMSEAEKAKVEAITKLKLTDRIKEHNLGPAFLLQAIAIWGAYMNQPLITLVCGGLVLYIVWIKSRD